MSREFGSYMAGFFHQQMEYAASDLEAADYEISRKWAPFFTEFERVAYAISSAEAGDSGEYFPIVETMNRIRTLQQCLVDIEAYVAPYRHVAEEAVRATLKKP